MKLNDYKNNMNIKGECSITFHHYYSLIYKHTVPVASKTEQYIKDSLLCAAASTTQTIGLMK